MPVDPEIRDILAFIAARNAPPTQLLSPEEARANMVKARKVFAPPEPVPLARVENRTLRGPAGAIPIRVYAAEATSTLPVFVFFHGGGWVIGSLDTHDDVCRRIARDSGCLVVSVDYRLAPEHRFPAAAEDAYAALTWIAEHAGELGGDPARLAVGGDSAGGNLAAVVAQQARDAGHAAAQALALQVLVYPAVDSDFTRPSYRAHADGYLLTFDAMAWFWEHYLPTVAQRADPAASPLRAASLADLPPAFVLLAEYDVLLDEGVAYAERLRAEGVPVAVRRFDGAIHGFLGMSVTEIARRAQGEIAAALRTAFSG